MFKLFAVLLLAVTVFGYPAVDVEIPIDSIDDAQLKLDGSPAVGGPIKLDAKDLLADTENPQKDDKDLEKSETFWGGWGGYGYRSYYPRYYGYGWGYPRYYGGWGRSYDYYW